MNYGVLSITCINKLARLAFSKYAVLVMNAKARAEVETEITPAMRWAGAEVIGEADEAADPMDLAARVYRAMRQARFSPPPEEESRLPRLIV